MRMMKFLTFLFLMSFLLCACKGEIELCDEFTKIEFDSTSFEIPKEGGLALVISKDSLWNIYGCSEIIDGEKTYIENEYYVIDESEIKYLKDTVYGDWYTLYKKQNIIAVQMSPNTENTERTVWIHCSGILRFDETITVKQK